MECPFVSRGGLKLFHALREFGVDVRGLACADFGCSTGGFTDCLLQSGAASVVAVDTAYGEFAWKLRNDPRVTLLERTNALHAKPHRAVELLVADLGWTRQKHLLPAAAPWLSATGRIITLIKPHYEQEDRRGAGVLSPPQAKEITDRVVREIESLGFTVSAVTESPIRGGSKGKSKAAGAGNLEWLALVTPARSTSSPRPDRPD
ncbi:MAG: SAM-dependent methyltransferase [Phycisphaerales bacterium]